MTFPRITACLTVDETNEVPVVSALNMLFDSLVIRRMPVFDTDIKTESVCDVEGAEELRREMLKP